MNDPERLLFGQADERERSLLSAAASEEPSAAALTRLQRTLGLTVDPAPSFGPEGPGQAAPAAPTSGTLWSAKWLLLGSAGVALIGALALTRGATSPSPRAAESAGAPAATTAEVAPSPEPPAPLAAPRADDELVTDPAASAATPPTLRDELARLELARSQLQRQRARAAQSALDDYDRVYPQGTLREEALALRIETLFLLRERASARRATELARSFLANYPESVHGARVRGQLEQHGAR